MNITIERRSADGLSREVWGFTLYAFPDTLRLDHWARETRPTKRHQKWIRDGEGYKHRSHNGPVHYGGYCRAAAEVPFPADVIAEAKAEIMKRLRVIGPVDPKDARR